MSGQNNQTDTTVVFRGETYEQQFDWLDINDVPILLQTWTGRGLFFPIGSVTPLTFPLILFDVSNNIHLNLTPAQTATFGIGTHELKLELTDPGGKVHIIPDGGNIIIKIRDLLP